ncbi:unnamed protein product [Microthlaspi erraticum]|uniref:Uncharacterized protein n=1 Tax=Microthlaspi erraticum TaxID=1685480 RepID=A0A6D2IZ06_9BRAS|nr:unnamed protein product [Microthlaspi erraticum]
MKRSYNQKSEDCPDGSIEKQRPNRAVRLAEERCSALGQSSSVRLKSRPKSKPLGRSRITTRETLPAVGQATRHTTAHDQSARAGKKPRGRATVRVPRRCIRPSRERTSHVRPRISSAKLIRSTTPADRESVRPRPFRLGHDPMSGRSSRTTVPTPRSTRSPFEAQTYVFKPGLTLSRL